MSGGRSSDSGPLEGDIDMAEDAAAHSHGATLGDPHAAAVAAAEARARVARAKKKPRLVAPAAGGPSSPAPSASAAAASSKPSSFVSSSSSSSSSASGSKLDAFTAIGRRYGFATAADFARHLRDSNLTKEEIANMIQASKDDLPGR